MNTLTQLIINSLQTGSVYVLVALGLTLVFGVMKVVNFAHGEFYTIGSVITYLFIQEWNFPGLFNMNLFATYVLTFVIVTVIIGILGLVIEKVIFSPFRGDMISGLIISLGLSMVVQIVLLIFLGTSPKKVPTIFPGTTNILGGMISNERIMIFIIALLLTIILYLVIQKTRLGKAMRAITQDREAAELQGINYNYISAWGFTIGVVLAAMAGVLVAPVSIVEPYIGSEYLMKAFIIIILGGLGSIAGCILAGFLLGFIESFGAYFFDLASATILSFVIVIIMLILRPQGLMGHGSK
jgi:branched-chain amino acid transport system permease protein